MLPAYPSEVDPRSQKDNETQNRSACDEKNHFLRLESNAGFQVVHCVHFLYQRTPFVMPTEALFGIT